MGGEWNIKYVPIEECVEEIIDYRGKTPEKSKNGIPLITAKIIKNGRIDTPTEFIPEDQYESWMRRGIPKSGDVLITSEAPLGEIAQLDNAKVALAQRVIVLRGKSNLLDNTYLRYVLKSPSVMDEIQSRATGTTVLGIKQSELKKVKIPLPSLSKQKLIGKMLFALDERVDLNLKINKTLEEIARAIFKRWFIDFEFPNENGEPFKSSGGEMIDSPLGPIPKGWRVGNISDIANILGGGTPRTSIDEYWDGDIPFFTPKDAKALYCIHTEKCLTKKGLQSCSSRLYEKNTVFITARGTVGKLALAGTPMAMNQSCYALTGKEVSQYFLYFAIDNLVDSLKQSSHGAVFSTITTATLESTKALIPEARMERNFRDRIASRVSRKGGPPKDSMVIPLN